MGGNELSLIGTGVTLGIVHVLTGPDHLSALATLSANVGNVAQAFSLGIRWGLGHSTGLLLVGIILIAWDAAAGSSGRRKKASTGDGDGDDGNSDDDDAMIHVPDGVSHFFESLVGIFMLLLGTYGIQRAWEKRPKVYAYCDYDLGIAPIASSSESSTTPSSSSSNEDDNDDDSSPTSTCQIKTAITAIGQEDQDVAPTAAAAAGTMDIESYHNQTISQHLSEQQPRQRHVVEDSPPGDDYEGMKSSFLHVHDHSHHHHHHTHSHFSVNMDGDERGDDEDSSSPWYSRCTRRISTRTMAVCAGIVHGLAGPGGVLGVIPAVQLHNGKLATIYLASFCSSSTLTMGLFAIFYGTCSNRLGTGLRVRRRGEAPQQQQDAITASASGVVATNHHTNTQCEFLIECISALLSILVGITWLTLLSIGKLEDVFP